MGKPANTGESKRQIGRLHLTLQNPADAAPKPLGTLKLTPPSLLRKRERTFSLFEPGKEPHLHLGAPDPKIQPQLFQFKPYLGMDGPISFQQLIKGTTTAPVCDEQATEATKRAADDGVNLGVDAQLDPHTFQLSLVLRDLNLIELKRGSFELDIIHEPTISAQFGFNPGPEFGTHKDYGPIAYGLSATFLDLHFQTDGKDFIELGFGSIGPQLDGRGHVSYPLGIFQGEIHDVFGPKASLFVNIGGTLDRPEGEKNFHFGNITGTVGFLYHFPDIL